ncbi:MAG: NAD(P)-dependent oxidoreductase [Deltaproteobacteria bacterium]|jgi:nucleoside-diphosphate-sugar epimerase|nr:NAD(P)-dependent oxidoreductase [Deltaproteobacteria bacterium]
MSDIKGLEGEKILLTGATGQLAYSIARKLARENTVHAIARFSAEGSRDRLEALGLDCIPFDYVEDDLDRLDRDYDYLLHFATTQIPGDEDFERAIEVNAVATGRLMAHFPDVKAFFFSSTSSVYHPGDHTPHKETDPLGEGMREHCPVYALSKIAAEAVVKFVSGQFDIPAVIARMNVSYGPNGGLPVMHLESIKKGEPIYLNSHKPNYFSPVHEDDYYRQMLKLLPLASSPPLLINWCGSELVSAEEWCEYMAELLGTKVAFVYRDEVFPCSPCDSTLLDEKVGRTEIDWREGMRRLVEEGAADPRRVRTGD